MSTIVKLKEKVLELENNTTEVIQLIKDAKTDEEKAFWFLSIKDSNNDEGWGVKMELNNFPTEEKIQEFVNMEDKELFEEYYKDTVDKISEYGLSITIDDMEASRKKFISDILEQIRKNPSSSRICQDSMWITIDAVMKVLNK